MKLELFQEVGDFAEDKDVAARLRTDVIKPPLTRHEECVLDFDGVEFATQSFVHALVSDLIRDEQLEALDLMVFENCTESVKGIVAIVVDYSQELVAD